MKLEDIRKIEIEDKTDTYGIYEPLTIGDIMDNAAATQKALTETTVKLEDMQKLIEDIFFKVHKTTKEECLMMLDNTIDLNYICDTLRKEFEINVK